MKIYVFIDAQNLHLNIKHQGWNLDYKKFFQYLTDKYRVTKVILFIGWIKEQKRLYEKLRSIGYSIVFKETTRYIQDGKVCYKGNVDAELVLYCAKVEFYNYNKAIIVSGDGDFKCLVRYLDENKKLQRILIPNKLAYSSLLFPYREYMDFISDQRNKLKI